jgi:hypothetical protein
MTELATNSTAKNVSWVIYSGNDDLLVPHLGTEGASLSFLVIAELIIHATHSRDPKHDLQGHPGFHSQAIHGLVR